MSLLAPDVPYGSPAFALSDDQVATVLDLVCRGAYDARADVSQGMLEVPVTVVVRKAIRRLKRTLGLTNLQLRGEHELKNMAAADPSILGRIDITLQFLHQFGQEDAYVGVEYKRVRAGDASLNGSHVSKGVDRFATGQYAAGHEWGFMLGYVLSLPVESIVDYIDTRLKKVYGPNSALVAQAPHPNSLAVLDGALQQGSHHTIRLKHIFINMLTAAGSVTMS